MNVSIRVGRPHIPAPDIPPMGRQWETTSQQLQCKSFSGHCSMTSYAHVRLYPRGFVPLWGHEILTFLGRIPMHTTTHRATKYLFVELESPDLTTYKPTDQHCYRNCSPPHSYQTPNSSHHAQQHMERLLVNIQLLSLLCRCGLPLEGFTSALKGEGKGGEGLLQVAL